jgi:hypothetical protein
MFVTRLLAGALLAFAATAAQPQSAVPPTDATPRFPKGVKGLAENQSKPPSSNWLLDAGSDAERFRRIEIVSGGTDGPMWEISHRFGEVHLALADGNLDLALYHWQKIRDRANGAMLKRPMRTPNLEGMFIDGSWKNMEAALRSKDVARARTEFLAQREVCMACHVAEKVGFMNTSAIFRQTAAFPDAKR